MRRIGVVNRGEAAARCLRTVRALRAAEADAPEAVALYTAEDAGASFLRLADAARSIGAHRDAYLDAERVLAALRDTGCDAAWLGWGFASEDAAFAAALEDAGLILLAPTAESIARLGDKIAARSLAERCGVPLAAWARVDDAADCARAAERLVFPVMVKASGGGGGRGIKRVDRAEDLPAAIEAVQREVAGAFGRSAVFVEEALLGARHIEVQIVGDGRGRVVTLGVRDCSLQRRRQKVIEECPAPHLPRRVERALLDAARRLGEAVAYRSAGTVEFLYCPGTGRIAFLEVNARLQVEHPITEAVYGVDLVRWQIDIAGGRPLPPAPHLARGWAVEARVCAEDPDRGFAPTPGRIARMRLPTGPGVRVDTGFAEGDRISPAFDSLVAKVIASGADRTEAHARLAAALAETALVIEGGASNLRFLRDLLADPAVRAGRVSTALVESRPPMARPGAAEAVIAAALDARVAGRPVEQADGLAVHRLGPDRFVVTGPAGRLPVRYAAVDRLEARLTIGDHTARVERVPGDAVYQIDGVVHRVEASGAGRVRAPSPAMVVALPVAPGAVVRAGDPVVVVEAMKMEFALAAPAAGRVRALPVAIGQAVEAGAVVAILEAEAEGDEADGPGLGGLPWRDDPIDRARAADDLRAALCGWDVVPGSLPALVEAIPPDAIAPLRATLADLAAVWAPDPPDDPPVLAREWLIRARAEGIAGLPMSVRARLERALAHFGDAEAFDRLAQAGRALPALAALGPRLAERDPTAGEADIAALRALAARLDPPPTPRESPGALIARLCAHPELPPMRVEPLDPADDAGGVGVWVGLATTPSPIDGRAWRRVLVIGDATVQMGALGERECRRVIAALDRAAALDVPVEWIATSSGARIGRDSGTENLDWTARVLRRIVEFTHAGGQIDLIVAGTCVGAQSYWNAEATMLMHTRGLLVMTDAASMVLTGKRALDASGCVSAESEVMLGGYAAVMGPNGQAQVRARDVIDAYRCLYDYHAITRCAPGAARPPRAATADPADRDIGRDAYPAALGHGFDRIADVFCRVGNAERKRPFAVRPIMAALVDRDAPRIERWGGLRDADNVVAWEARIGGFAATVLGVDNQPRPRVGPVPETGPDALAGGTLYPESSRKLARAINAASGRRPVVVLASLSGFDGSPESLRARQLELGAEIGRAVTRFEGTLVFVVLARYHGGAYVVFSKALNPGLVAVALEGSFASVIGGHAAARVVLGRAVRERAAARGGGAAALAEATAAVAGEFDAIHDIERARRVGSIDAIIAPSALRRFVIDRLAADWRAAAGEGARSEGAR